MNYLQFWDWQVFRQKVSSRLMIFRKSFDCQKKEKEKFAGKLQEKKPVQKRYY